MRLLVWTAFGLAACTGVPSDDKITLSDADEDGYSSAEGDCNDQDPDIHPGAPDIVGDGIDHNCDQSDGVDADGDRDPSEGSGGGDCNDDDASINSKAEEIGWDGIDQDCDLKDQYDFEDICAGDEFTCGISTVGEIHCWGSDQDGVLSNRPLEGDWVQLDCGQEYVCAREYDNSVVCWGNDVNGVVSSVPKDSALEIFTGKNHVCIVRQTDGRPQCWGDPDAYSGIAGLSQSIVIRDMALGDQFTCIIQNQGGTIGCFGKSLPYTVEYPLPDNVGAEWIRISAGSNYICGIWNVGEAIQSANCFGPFDSDDRLEPDNTPGPYSTIDTFNNWSCLIKEADELSCFGLNDVARFPVKYGEPNSDVSLFSVAVGGRHGCALRNEDGEVTCWGKTAAPGKDVPDFAGYAGK